MRVVLSITAILLSGLGYGAVHAGLRDVRSVYVLPMSGNLDQYLANALVKDGHFDVVTDPQRADAVLAERLGEGFERKMDELYAPKKQDKESEDQKQVRVGGFSRSRGTVFLVDRESRSVLWSAYEPGRGTKPGDVEARARSIMDRLRKAVKTLEKHPPVQHAAPAEPAKQ